MPTLDIDAFFKHLFLYRREYWITLLEAATADELLLLDL